MGKGVTGVRGAGLWGQQAHLGRRRRRWSRLSAGRSRRSRASAANLPRGTLASGRRRAGGRGERDRGSAWSKRAVGGGAGGNGCGDAAAISIGGRGVRRAGSEGAGEGVVAPGPKRPLLLLQLGGLASAVDGGVGGVVLVGHDEEPSARSPHFPCHAPTRRQRGVERWV